MKLLARSSPLPRPCSPSPAAAARPTVNGPDRPARRHLQARRSSSPSGPIARRQAGSRLVLDRAAGRHAAHAVQDRARAAHGRAPDHRPERPRLHRSTSIRRSAKTTISRDGHVPGAGPLPGRRRRLPGDGSTSVNANFQLFGKLDGRRRVQAEAAPADVDGSEGRTATTFTLHGAADLKAIQAQLVTVDVTGPDRQARDVHALVRRARPRDLLPPGQPRLLPHPRLRARA